MRKERSFLPLSAWLTLLVAFLSALINVGCSDGVDARPALSQLTPASAYNDARSSCVLSGGTLPTAGRARHPIGPPPA